MAVCGIDLGTTNSLIAVFGDDGPELIPNALGDYLTPSVVGVDDDGSILVGQAAKHRLLTHPDQTVARFKRFMGADRTFELVPPRRGRRWETQLPGTGPLKAEDLSALVLKSLKQDAEAQLGEEVRDVVVSVPAYFNETQRRATRNAGEIAGLNVVRLVNEPTAAALAYGLQDRDQESEFFVFDLGGGTFDVSILEIYEGVMEVNASAGDAFLGGEDFTDNLAKELARQVGEDFHMVKARRRAEFRDVAERMKRALTQEPVVSDHVRTADEPLPVSISRENFVTINKDVLQRLKEPIERSLHDSGRDVRSFDRVVLVGGGTNMPAIRDMVTRVFGKFPEFGIDPDHVVALGAAVQAGLVAEHRGLDDVVMTDVAPFTMGIAVSERVDGDFISDIYSPLIERNTPLPTSRRSLNGPLFPDQKFIRFQVFQGESPTASENLKLGELDVPLPPDHNGDCQVETRFTYDLSGLLEVDIQVMGMSEQHNLLINNLAGSMTEEEVRNRLAKMQELKINPRDDAENRVLHARLEAAYQMALGPDRNQIQEMITVFTAALNSEDPARIAAVKDQISKELKHLGPDYA